MKGVANALNERTTVKPTDATDARIALNLLIEWPENPRKTRNDVDVVQMSTNLQKAGQLAPLIVFKPAGETLYSVIEGETRRRAFNMNATAGKITADTEIRCWIMPEDATLERLLVVAAAANTIRSAMNPIEEMEAYSAMAQAGIKVRAIAETFGIDKKVVEQRLALGNLVPSARDLVRSGKRQMGWAQAMTVGSPASQERIVAEIDANSAAHLDGSSVRAELTRGNIPVASALFDPIELNDCLVRDLFTPDGNYFSDVDKFWERQKVEIDKKVSDLRQTHANVKFVDRTRFDDAGWTTGGEPSESTAVVIAHDDGSVEIREGLIAPVVDESDDGEGSFLSDAGDHYDGDYATDGVTATSSTANPASSSNDGASANDADANPNDQVVQKIEVNPLDNATKETIVYLTSQVSAALKLAIASDPRLALATVVAASLTRNGPSTSLSVAGLPLDPQDRTAQVYQQLQAKRAARDRIATDAGIAGMNSPAEVIRKLLNLEAGLLEQIFAYTVADSILVDLNDTTVDIFDALGAEIMAGWRIEENYLKTLSTAQVRVLGTEVLDTDNLPSPRAARSQFEHAIIESVEATALQGDFMGSMTWIPPQITSLLEKAAERRAANTDTAELAEAA